MTWISQLPIKTVAFAEQYNEDIKELTIKIGGG